MATPEWRRQGTEPDYRFSLANERTFLAWIRTVLAVLASAVLLDAVVVRSVIVPGLMLALGRANWWLPSWLERFLPPLNVEGSASPEAAPSHASRVPV